MSILSLDLGSRRIGSVIGSDPLPGSDPMPSIQTAEVIPVEQDLSIAVEIARARIASWSEPITSAVIEHNPVPYMPRNVTPQEAMRIAEAYARCSGLRDRLV